MALAPELSGPLEDSGIVFGPFISSRSMSAAYPPGTTDDLFAFLTCPPNAEVEPIHPKAMPVILTEPDEWQTWLQATFSEASALPKPLADGLLALVAEGAPLGPAAPEDRAP